MVLRYLASASACAADDSYQSGANSDLPMSERVGGNSSGGRLARKPALAPSGLPERSVMPQGRVRHQGDVPGML